MIDQLKLSPRQEQVLRALMAQKLVAGEGNAAIVIVCRNGSSGIGGAAEGPTPRRTKRVWA